MLNAGNAVLTGHKPCSQRVYLRNWQTFSIKGQKENISGFVGHIWPLSHILLFSQHFKNTITILSLWTEGQSTYRPLVYRLVDN